MEFAARMKQKTLINEQLAKKKRASELAFEKARVVAAASLLSSRNQHLEAEAEANAQMRRKMLRDKELYEAAAAAAAKRMRERWRADAPRHQQLDPYAEWRGGLEDVWEEGEEDEDVDEAGASDEEREQAQARRAKAKERDDAARRILAYSSKTLTEALGLEVDATDAEVDSCVRRLLRLLHPDYSINLAMAGTRRQQRIEAAFKRLNGLRNTCVEA